MSEQSDTSPDDEGEQAIKVCRMTKANGVTTRQIVRAVSMALGDRETSGISVAVVDDATISSLNERYLGDAACTDVLAFDLRDDAEDERIEGELVISAETAQRQARRFCVDPREELLRYVIHGTLHLMGHDDETSAGRRRMRQAEDRILVQLIEPARPRAGERKKRRTTGGV